MAAPAAAVAPALPVDAKWAEVEAYVDAMPGVPSWKQIEAEVDAALKAEIDAETRAMVATGHAHLINFERMVPHAASNRWKGHLRRLYPHVYRVVYETMSGSAMLAYGPVTWYVTTYLPVAAWDRHIANEWYDLREGEPPLTLQRLSIAQARAMLAVLATKSPAERAGYNGLRARFEADLKKHIMQERTDLAQSRLIDHLAMRDRDVAHLVSRWIAPETITTRRPLAVHTGPSLPAAAAAPPPMTRQQYLASILDTMHAPGQDPAAVLARSRAMLETLMQSIEQQQPQQM